MVNIAINHFGSILSNAMHCSPVGSGVNHSPNSTSHSANHTKFT